jgi:hypothetical protein
MEQLGTEEKNMAGKSKYVMEHIILDGVEIEHITEDEVKEIKWVYVTQQSYANHTIYLFTNEPDLLVWLESVGLKDSYIEAEKNRQAAIEFMETDEYKDNVAQIHDIQQIQIKGATRTFLKILDKLEIDPSDPDLVNKVEKKQNILTGRILHTSAVFAEKGYKNQMGPDPPKHPLVPNPQPLIITDGTTIDDMKAYIGWNLHISSVIVYNGHLRLYAGPHLGFPVLDLGPGRVDIPDLSIQNYGFDDKAQSLQQI